MKRLRRAYQRQTSKRNKFRQRAIAAGTVAAITLGAGAGLNKALAKDKWALTRMRICSPTLKKPQSDIAHLLPTRIATKSRTAWTWHCTAPP